MRKFYEIHDKQLYFWIESIKRANEFIQENATPNQRDEYYLDNLEMVISEMSFMETCDPVKIELRSEHTVRGLNED